MSQPIDVENLGVWVDEQCEKLGVSKARLARDARIHPETIRRWRHGDHEPSLYNYRRVTRVISEYWARYEDEAKCG
jgi:ribosome-binding protein aMBF1 (putative translation factor)